MSALNKQVAGDHYKDQPIQPVEYIHANAMGYFEGNVVKYVSRWRKKNGIADLEKAKHYIDHYLTLVDRVDDEDVYFVLTESLVLSGLGVCWLFSRSFKFTEEHTAILRDEHTIGHSSPCGAGEFVRKHTF